MSQEKRKYRLIVLVVVINVFLLTRSILSTRDTDAKEEELRYVAGHYDKLLNTKKQTAEDYFQHGLALQALGEDEKALASLRKAKWKDSSVFYAQMYKAQNIIVSKDRNAGSAFGRHLSHRYPASEGGYFLQGMSDFHRGEYDDAYTSLMSGYWLNPHHQQLQYILALTAEKVKNFSLLQNLSSTHTNTPLNQKSFYYLLMKGVAAKRQKDYTNAKEYLIRAREIDKRDVLALWHLGQISLEQKRYQEAYEIFGQGVSDDTSNEFLKGKIKASVALGNYDQAEDAIEKLFAKKDKREGMIYQLILLDAKGEEEQRDKKIKEVAVHIGKSPYYNANLARVIAKMDRYEQAQQHIDYAINRFDERSQMPIYFITRKYEIAIRKILYDIRSNKPWYSIKDQGERLGQLHDYVKKEQASLDSSSVVFIQGLLAALEGDEREALDLFQQMYGLGFDEDHLLVVQALYEYYEGNASRSLQFLNRIKNDLFLQERNQLKEAMKGDGQIGNVPDSYVWAKYDKMIRSFYRSRD